MTRPSAQVSGVRSVRFAAALAVFGLVLATMFGMAQSAAAAAPPTVASLSVSSGPTTGNTPITITGTNFDSSSVVSFGSANVAPTSWTPTQLTVLSPVHSAGQVDVRVTTTLGGISPVNSPYDVFTFYGPLYVSGVNPPSGPFSGGTLVTVFGSGFLGGVTQVTFGGLPFAGSFSVQSDNQLTVTSPPHFPGTVDVVVWVNSLPSAQGPNDHFLYTGGLAVTSVSPASGPSSGGTTVTITGSGFSTATGVTFGASPAVFPAVYSDNFLTVIAPPHLPGPVDVRVWSGTNVSPSSPADIFLYTGGTILSGVSPTTGPTTGGTHVILTGSGLAGTTAVTFGGVAATNIIVTSDNQVIVTTPAHAAGTVNVTVVTTNYYGFGTTASGAFTYIAAGPTITGVVPNSGTTAGGTQVTVTGSGFSNATSVSFGGTPGTGLSVSSDSQLTVNAPAHSAGTVDVMVTANGAGSATNANDHFTYIQTPPVNPPARFVGSVTINGEPAAPGTTVEARIGSNSCGTGSVFLSGGQARYALDAVSSDATSGCGSDGATVTFFVGGVQAPQTGTWHSYQLNVVDLNVGAAPPPPTPRPTVAPLPPNAGGGSGTPAGDTRLALFMLGTLAVLAAAALGLRVRSHGLVPVVADQPALESVADAHEPAADQAPEYRRRWLGLAAVGAALGVGLFLRSRQR